MIDMNKIYLITDIPGYTPEVSRLLSMINYARFTTIRAVTGMTPDQLDFLLDEKSNSIGCLLAHFAAVEYAYQVHTFEGREDLTVEEEAEWGVALRLGDDARVKIKGHHLDYYLNRLSEVRNRTYELFRKVDDAWLHIEQPFWQNKPGNHYFMWFHVFEDEINHRGQIRLIKKRM
jgi:uncharacterized damage-inducible protein DinB